MTRRLAVLIAAAALLLGALGAPAQAVGGRSWTVQGMEQQLMCPICKTRLDMSDSPAAHQIIQALTVYKRRGLTETQVKRLLVASYGQSVLADTPRHGFGLLAWLAPAAVLLAGAGIAVLGARRWAARRRAPGALAVAAPPAERDRLERRLDAELAAFDE